MQSFWTTSTRHTICANKERQTLYITGPPRTTQPLTDKDKQHAGMAQSTACSAVILSVHSTFGSSKISTAGLVVFLNIKKYINNYKKIYKKNRKEIASILVYLKNMHTKNKKTKKQYE